MRALSLLESSVYPSARVRFCARAKEIRARAGRFARKQGDSRSRIILIYFRATKMCSRHLAVKLRHSCKVSSNSKVVPTHTVCDFRCTESLHLPYMAAMVSLSRAVLRSALMSILLCPPTKDMHEHLNRVHSRLTSLQIFVHLNIRTKMICY